MHSGSFRLHHRNSSNGWSWLAAGQILAKAVSARLGRFVKLQQSLYLRIFTRLLLN